MPYYLDGCDPQTYTSAQIIHLDSPPAQIYWMIGTETYILQRERSRSPRRPRSRSPGRSTRRRSYSPRSRSRSRDEHRRTDRRSRSPMSGQGPTTGSGSNFGGGAVPHRSFEERAAAREQMMSSVRAIQVRDYSLITKTYRASSGSRRNKTAAFMSVTYLTMLSGTI